MLSFLKKLNLSENQTIISVFSGMIAFITPVVPIMITVFAFIFADTYYGYKVSKLYGHKLESRGIWKMINKITEVFTVITLGLLLDKYIFMDMETMSSVKIVAGIVCSAEALSLMEAFRALHPRSLLSKILAKVVKSKAEKYLEVDLSDVIDIKEFTDDEHNCKSSTKSSKVDKK